GLRRWVQPCQTRMANGTITESGTIVQVRGSVNGGWLARATCQTAVRYMIGIITIESSMVSLPRNMCTSYLRGEISCVCATIAAIHRVKTVPCRITAGGSVGFGRGYGGARPREKKLGGETRKAGNHHNNTP